jgi:hypothetical protein
LDGWQATDLAGHFGQEFRDSARPQRMQVLSAPLQPQLRQIVHGSMRRRTIKR